MKKQAGFTLIEILVAIAVLSVMTGVLFRVFVVSSRIISRSAADEKAVNFAKDTMEVFKAYPLSDAEKEIAGGNTKVTVRDEEWDVANEEKSYVFTRSVERGINSWFVEVKADYGKYANSEPGKNSILEANLYGMPRIADVDTIQNSVIAPDMLLKEDELLENRLLAKVNPSENSDSESEGSESSVRGGGSESENVVFYTEDDIRRILNITIDSKNEGKGAGIGAQLIYTVASDTVNPDKASGYPAELTVKTGVYSAVKTIVKTEDGQGMENGIYIFLPESPVYERIFISAVKRSDKMSYPMYVVAPKNGTVTGGEYSSLDGFLSLPETLAGEYEIVKVYSNIPKYAGGVSQLAGRELPYNRIYSLSVSVYESGSGDTPKGNELITIISSKRE